MADTKSEGPSGAAVGMAGVQILSGFLQAEMVRRQAESQARIAEFNAQLAEYDAWRTMAYGQTVIARSQNETDQARGSTKLYAASKGIEISGSLEEITAQNELNSYLNRIDMDNRATEQAMGYKRQASQIRLGSQMQGIQSNIQSNSLVMGSIASGAGTIAASAIANQKISEEDMNLAKKTSPSGYDSFKSQTSELVNKSYQPLGFNLMPGGG